MEKVVERFLRYATIDTQSDPESPSCPSTEKQLDLAGVLVRELQEIGMQDVALDENGYVMAALPANVNRDIATIGFIAHMDTSPDMLNRSRECYLRWGRDCLGWTAYLFRKPS